MPKKLKWETHADLAIRRRPSIPRRAYLDHMCFVADEGPLFTEIFGPIVGLKEEWLAQGATPAELDFSAFSYRIAARGFVPVHTGLFGVAAPTVVEETEDYILSRDGLGRLMRLNKGVATLPLPLEYPVKNMDDWLRIKASYQFNPARLSGDWAGAARDHLDKDRVLCVGIPGGFDEPRQLMGEEALCLAYYEQPDLLHDMLETFAATAVAVLERVCREVKPDLLFVHEDMAGRSGPLIGPRQVEEFIAPYYRRVWELLADNGARLFDQDSDGDMTPVIPAFLDAGVNLMHPMEPAAGMDIVQIRQRFGKRLAFYGGIDKHVLRRDREAIRAELEYKIPPMVATGGCALGLDHRIPNGTPLAHYRYYVDTVWEILGRESGRASLKSPLSE